MIVDSIVAEKTVLLGDHARIEIKTVLPPELAGIGIPITSDEISCVLSNLIRNSIDALGGQTEDGQITIRVSSTGDRIALSIQDNGCGIPPETLKKLRTIGGTYGKSGGVGLGLDHAKRTMVAMGGSLSIDSQVGKGTTVTLDMPVAQPPKWCPKSLDCSTADTIVVLEDDESVILLWKQRLGEGNVVYLRDPSEFDLARFPKDSCFYIFDHELGESKVTGLDLIRIYELGNKAVLVTSYFNTLEIQQGIEATGAGMLPKFMVPQIEIRRSVAVACDLVLIDDDPLVGDLWSFEAANHGRSVMSFVELNDFMEAFHHNPQQFALELPIFVDKNLGNGASGFDVAKTLDHMGFTRLYMTTGDPATGAPMPSYIRSVCSKAFPVEFILGSKTGLVEQVDAWSRTIQSNH